MVFCTYEGETTMANKKTIGTVLLVAGVILLVVSLGADVFGLGEGGARFGSQQILGAVAGLILLVAGLVYSRR
jgi:hypothetical protein